MGIMFSKIFERMFGSKEVRILILGLDNAGKTTILYRLQNESDEAVQTIPTIGFNVETLQYKNIKVSKRDAVVVKHCCGRSSDGVGSVGLTPFDVSGMVFASSSKYGTWVDRPAFDRTGGAITPIPTQLSLWSTVPIRSACRSHEVNWRPCWKKRN